MSHDFTAALRAEIAQLEAALESDLRYRRLRELVRVRDLYQDATEPYVGEQARPSQAPRITGRRTSPERAKALSVARIFLTNRVGPTPTRDIYDHLVSEGVTLSGDNPVNNLSAMLSNSEEFVAHGRSGWTIRTEADAIDESVLSSLVQNILADLTSERLQTVHNEVRSGQGIASDIDGKLLAQTRVAVGRDLSPDEKRHLREAFKEGLESLVS